MDTEKKAYQTTIITAADMHLDAAKTLNNAVRNARRVGLSWAEIGDALGVSKQAAQQRFSRTVGEDKASRTVDLSDREN